jgi:hypothetical protein
VARFGTYILSIAALPVMLVGIVILVGAGTDAYMVVFGGAKPGDAIFLDTLASPLRESLVDVALGICIIAIGLLTRAFARRLRRPAPNQRLERPVKPPLDAP